MIALPLSILALAAGVYLLIKVNKEYLGGIFKFFAWLVIILSLVAVGGVVCKAVRHHCCGNMQGHCGMMQGRCGMMQGHCDMQEHMMNKEMQHCSHEGADSVCPMSGCKMSGDSVVLDRAVCEKMMGKEACEKLCKERGQCIMTKDECSKMCGGTAKCGNPKGCCKGEEKEMKPCCKGEAEAKKACCKKK